MQASLFPTGAAQFSDDGAYRYRLERQIADVLSDRTVVFVMCNPSVADAEADDPTIRRCIGFARRWGYGKLVVVNLYALVATHPADLADSYQAGCDIVGEGNDAVILAAARSAQLVVCAWGAVGAAAGAPGRDQQVLAMLRQYGRTPHCLGLTGEGHPKHPLARGVHAVPANARPVPMAGGDEPHLPAAA